MPGHKLETILNLPKRQMSITEARNDLAEVVNRVAYRPERVNLTRRGRVVTGLIPVEALALVENYEQILKLLEKESPKDAANLRRLREQALAGYQQTGSRHHR